MNTNDIITIIQCVGFPIVMCGVMGWYVKYMSDRNHDDMEKERNQHDDEMKEITQAINNNTIALQKLADIIGSK